MDKRLITLSQKDNVVVALAQIPAGDTVEICGKNVELSADLQLGHKVACKSIQMGESILKYGVPIGTATTEIKVGELVHVHNIRSNYTKTYTLDDASGESTGDKLGE